jgi:hypothetical protein
MSDAKGLVVQQIARVWRRVTADGNSEKVEGAWDVFC